MQVAVASTFYIIVTDFPLSRNGASASLAKILIERTILARRRSLAGSSGSGDMLTAILAIPAAVLVLRARAGWEKWVLAWNVIGFWDFASAIFLGVASTPASPLRLFMDAPGTALLGDLPWRFIPGYYVPLFLMIHIALFIRLVPVVLKRQGP